ncbi:hypothetical protein [Halioxenophilus sp. WMMB6]|uniref:hypothetical protein n=1 Tax=Halioxenophilus sp. WMMB6 TaxID=3073815 RepID=UPI00295EB237|nr:hypothetical protein [Halioxenophilus sp. WMMB6]
MSRGEAPLHYAAKANQLAAVELLVNSGSEVNALEYFIGAEFTWFNTPLDLIAEEQGSELYQFLMANGALPASAMDEPKRLLMIAAREHN